MSLVFMRCRYELTNQQYVGGQFSNVGVKKTNYEY